MDTAVKPDQIANDFQDEVSRIKASIAGISWYPHRSLSNINIMADDVLPDWVANGLRNGFTKTHVLDVGPADGDLGYLFAKRGCKVSFIDYAPTNYNNCKGIKTLGKALRIKHKLIERDIDRGFTIKGQYDLALCLGLLYHLRNPMLVLMELAGHCNTMLLSTRVSSHFKDGPNVEPYACAYFLECRESNNDPTNFWNFSPEGLRRVLKRSGWIVKASKIVGARVSNPIDRDADARMFVYCERVKNWRDLGKHHDF